MTLAEEAHAEDELAVQACPSCTREGVTAKENWKMLQTEDGISGGRMVGPMKEMTLFELILEIK